MNNGELLLAHGRCWRVALQTGLRQSNVVKLEWPQVNLEQSYMWVNAAQLEEL